LGSRGPWRVETIASVKEAANQLIEQLTRHKAIDAVLQARPSRLTHIYTVDVAFVFSRRLHAHTAAHCQLAPLRIVVSLTHNAHILRRFGRHGRSDAGNNRASESVIDHNVVALSIGRP
jgi:hypothetical protein